MCGFRRRVLRERDLWLSFSLLEIFAIEGASSATETTTERKRGMAHACSELLLFKHGFYLISLSTCINYVIKAHLILPT